jgi:fructose-specific phosphotransferase system IIC component
MGNVDLGAGLGSAADAHDVRRRHPPGVEMLRLLGAVMVGSAATGVGLTLIGLFLLRPQGPAFQYYAVQLLSCALNLWIGLLIWRFVVRRPRTASRT